MHCRQASSTTTEWKVEDRDFQTTLPTQLLLYPGTLSSFCLILFFSGQLFSARSTALTAAFLTDSQRGDTVATLGVEISRLFATGDEPFRALHTSCPRWRRQGAGRRRGPTAPGGRRESAGGSAAGPCPYRRPRSTRSPRRKKKRSDRRRDSRPRSKWHPSVRLRSPVSFVVGSCLCL